MQSYPLVGGLKAAPSESGALVSVEGGSFRKRRLNQSLPRRVNCTAEREESFSAARL